MVIGKLLIGLFLLIIVGVFMFVLGMKSAASYYLKRIKKIENTKNHYWNSFLMLDAWLGAHQRNLSISQYLKDKGYLKIAIYGMGEAGKRLYEELKDSEIEIKYGIDASAGDVNAKIDVDFPDDDLEKVDAVVVTVPYYFKSIESTLKKKGFQNIYALDDILNSLAAL